MRDKLVGGLRPYVEGEEAEVFGKKLTAAEDWCVVSFLYVLLFLPIFFTSNLVPQEPV